MTELEGWKGIRATGALGLMSLAGSAELAWPKSHPKRVDEIH